MVHRNELTAYMDTLLEIERFKDYGPNGLQVEGRTQINRVVCGVTASLALIEQAIAAQADAVVVHHGLFWRGQDGRIVGWMKQRLQRLLVNDVSLYAYHLPLDAAPILGNNAVLGQRLGLKVNEYIGDQGLIALGEPDGGVAWTLEEIQQKVAQTLQRDPLVIAGDGRPLKRIAWCSGGAQGYFETAIAAGADVYLTGEISEPQMHYARETGVAFLACGHHATERYGIQALAQNVSDHFGIECQYIEVDNPA